SPMEPRAAIRRLSRLLVATRCRAVRRRCRSFARWPRRSAIRRRSKTSGGRSCPAAKMRFLWFGRSRRRSALHFERRCRVYKHRIEASARFSGAQGECTRRRGISGFDRNDVGKYTIRFPVERPIRTDTHHLSLTLLGRDKSLTAHFVGEGGALIDV